MNWLLHKRKAKRERSLGCYPKLLLVIVAEQKGLEPSASGVTGRRYNRLNYCSALAFPLKRGVVGGAGIEPATLGL